MSQSVSTAEVSKPFQLSIDIVIDTACNILDLSGDYAFTFDVHIGRHPWQGKLYPEAHSLPIDVLTNGSLLDVSSALKTGLLSLVEVQGDPPTQKWKDCTSSEIPTESISGTTYDLSMEPLRYVRLVSGFSAPPTDRQRMKCGLDKSISSVMKDGVVYILRYRKNAFPEHGRWNGGISWWKLCTDPKQSVDLSAPTDEPQVAVRNANLPHFKAMLHPPHPPKISYELEISPAVISLSDASPIKITVRFRLCEPTKYTVMWRRNTTGSNVTALGEKKLGSFSFDIFDVSTGETISATPQYGNALWTPGLSMGAIEREQLRELHPNQLYVSELELDGGEDKMRLFLKYFRIADASELLNRKLGVRLRPVDTFWSAQGIEELFEHEEKIKRDYWYILLTIQSPAKAEFSLVT